MAFEGFMEDFLTGHIYPIVKFQEQIIEFRGLTEHIYYLDK
jgi:hypothetical protein